ncbi:MAG: hypothetical protein JNK64_20380 [Myxococcales bacterium]|nr:hypothetical protein [Myxococcales bacterium]
MRPSPLALVVALALTACGAHRPGRCGDTVGAWSAPVDGLRARLITSGARADRAALQVALEIEPVAGPRTIHWTGMLDLGYVTFALDDAAGAPVPAALAWGGNGPGGSFREALPARVRHLVATNLFVPVDGRRLVRIGAFGGGWPMATDGTSRRLRARVTGAAPASDELEAYVVDPAVGSLGARVVGADAAAAPAWVGTLDVPAVCVD